MTRCIYKYPILIDYEQEISLPHGAIIRHFGVQDGELFVWAEFVAGTAKSYKVRLYVVGTGDAMPEEACHYIGTVHVEQFVWHLYSN